MVVSTAVVVLKVAVAVVVWSVTDGIVVDRMAAT